VAEGRSDSAAIEAEDESTVSASVADSGSFMASRFLAKMALACRWWEWHRGGGVGLDTLALDILPELATTR
jgi:hypothetical protein